VADRSISVSVPMTFTSDPDFTFDQRSVWA